jgi:hypothetical protein
MKHGLRKIASAILLVITLTACSQAATPTPAPIDPGATQVVALPTVASSDPCANEYFPVKNNASYTYSSTGSQYGPYSFTRKVTNAHTDGFTLASKFRDLEIVQEWSCKPEGLVANILGATDATSMLAFDKFTDLRGSNISGAVLPPSITPGMEWTYALDIAGTQKTNKTASPATMTGRVALTYTAGNKENITVPAGTFEAIAIEVSTVIDFVVAGQENTIDSTYTLWYAPGVGWVKSSGNGKLGGQEYFETIVLESYSIP